MIAPRTANENRDTPELDRVSQRRIERLAELLDGIQAESDPDLLQQFQRLYAEVPREKRHRLFLILLERMEIRKADIEGHLRGVLSAAPADPVEWSRLMTGLRRRIESPRMRAFRRFLNVSGGFKFLLDLRAHVLAAERLDGFSLEPLDEELSYLFNSWFQHGFLFLQEITRDSSFRQIQFLREHDMVHPMASLEEMGKRLGRDHRCFALYHKAMPEEPVVFIEVALTRGIARSIHQIIREGGEPSGRSRPPDTATFYSINNTQNGLAGLGLGKVLVLQVVEAIRADRPGIKTFATLSPVPGLWPRYLRPILSGDAQTFRMNRDRVAALVPERARRALARRAGSAGKDMASVLGEILSDPHWIDDPAYAKWIRRPLTEITYFYLTQETDAQGKLLNPVAAFHVNNGATLSFRNVNFGANRSERGLADSCGMMVNYVYSGTWFQQIRPTMRSWLPWKL